jgi:uncharacterized protein
MNKNFSNALINETSPYLLQHAHNPVNWYPWGEQALNLAKEKDLPILVSIGYSACHWCHVMERESFENETVADYMNGHFINIKIDREERPDLDHIYMDALQAMTGSGGWPLNVFLTTDAKPFYGGTYFPPVKAFNRPSWTDVLHSITDIWQKRRSEAEAQANILIEHIKKASSFEGWTNLINPEKSHSFLNDDTCRQMAEGIMKNADSTAGGFGKAPKFLQTFSIQYLLAYASLMQVSGAKDHALSTLRKMLNGGIYDQLAGGISRYSTDDNWLLPHFEKMLYDNALLVSVLCDAFQLTRADEFKNGIINTLAFITNEMKHPDGGYFTALDADSEGVEGRFYVWEKSEIEQLLEEKTAVFCDFYNVTENGNWEGKNILNVTHSAETIAQKHELTVQEFAKLIAGSREKLMNARNKRKRPGTDDKILLSCNALLITAFCKAYAALGMQEYKDAAITLFAFIENKFKDDSVSGCLFHTYKNNEAKYPAFLDDYAYLIQSCIHLQEISSAQEYLVRARELTRYVLQHFAHESNAFFYYTPLQQKDIVVRKIELYDGATPSANGVMLHNLLYLGKVFDDLDWNLRALNMLQSISGAFTKHPSSFAVWAMAYLVQTAGINEIIITGKEIKLAVQDVLREYLPNKILQSSTKRENFPLLHEKRFESDANIYLCRNNSCRQPEKNVEDIIKLLKK